MIIDRPVDGTPFVVVSQYYPQVKSWHTRLRDANKFRGNGIMSPTKWWAEQEAEMLKVLAIELHEQDTISAAPQELINTGGDSEEEDKLE